MAGPAFKYAAFISYSHAKDRSLATALQTVMQSLGKAWWQRRAMRIFRDDTSLTATPFLWPAIQRALASSEYLVLMASPEAGQSVWVDREVSEWLSKKGDEDGQKRIIVCLTDGELTWDRQRSDFVRNDASVLPPSLAGKFTSEPLWVDLRSYRASPEAASTSDRQFPLLAAKIAAHIRDMSPDDLWSQEVSQQRKARRLALSAAFGLLMLAVAAISAFVVAERNRQEATAQGLRLIANRALQVAETDPMSALALALERIGDAGLRIPPLPEVLQSLQDPMLEAHELRLLARGTKFARSVDETRGRSQDFLNAKFLPKGRLIAATARDGSLTLWDGANGKLVAEPSRPSDERNDDYGYKSSKLKISEDGSRIITSFPGGEKTELWDGADGRHIATLNKNGIYPTYLQINRQYKDIVVGVGDKAKLFDLETGAAKGEALDVPGGDKCASFLKNVQVVACSPSGDRAVIFAGGVLEVWSVRMGQKIGSSSNSHTAGCRPDVSEHHFSADGTVVLLVVGDNEACVADLTTGIVDAGLLDDNISSPFGDNHYCIFAMSSDGRQFAEARSDGLVRLWQRERGIESRWRLTRLKGHVNRVQSVDFSPDGSLLLSTSMDGTMRIWDAQRARGRSSKLALASGADSEWLSEGDDTPVVVLHDGTVELLDRRTGSTMSPGEATLTESSPLVVVEGVARSREVALLAFGRAGEIIIRQFGVATSTRIATGQSLAPNSIAWDGKGNRIAISTSDCLMSIVTLPSGIDIGGATDVLPSRSAVRGGMGVCDIVLDRGRNRFIAAKAVEAAEGKEARISLLDLESGEQIAVLPWPETVSSLRFSPDGRVLVTASSNAVAAIWDVQNATLLHSLQNTSGAVLAIWGEAAGNGGRVAFGSTFDPVQVWDLVSGRPIATLIGHDFGAELAVFSADGRRLVTASQGGYKLRGGPVVVWDISSARPLARLTGLSRGAEAVGMSKDGALVVAHSEMYTEYGNQALAWRIESRVAKSRDDALALTTRCLTQEQRAAFFLPPEPPRWCIEQRKWPYDTIEWRQWSADKAAGKRPSLP